ncbi:hypothetical protein DRN39_06535 [Thermococci archaeon]|nr:MAG: hypothetical protein DRN39_06535 [Thermococci archaeon]
MRMVKLGIEWIDELLPEGFPINTSTLVSGPGGSGKPLIGYILALGWLKNDGKVVFMITSTTVDYLKNTMRLLGMDMKEYFGRIFIIELEPTVEGIEVVSAEHIKANFIKPNVWEEALALANIYLGNVESRLGIMVVGSALNLLFFSPNYGGLIHAKIRETLEKDKSKTYFFTVNSDVFREMIAELEISADNLMFSRMEKPMKLYLRITRMKGAPFRYTETEVPLSSEILESIRKEAEKGKKNLIPLIKRV